MYLTEKIAIKIGNNAKSLLNIDDDREQIIIYGAINFLQIIFAILWVIIFGILFGVLYEALLFSITVSILRKYSGGVHASSPSRCIIIGTIVATMGGIITNDMLNKLSVSTIMTICIICMVFAFIVVIKNAPVDSINKPITDIKLRKQFKKKSIIVILIFSFFDIMLFLASQRFFETYYINFILCISLAIIWQSITLTKIGISLLNKVDFTLKNIIDFVFK